MEAIITRDAGAGYRIEADWDGKDLHPQAPVRVRVLAAGGKIVLDEFNCDLRDTHDVVNHTAMFSEAYAEALR